MNKNNRENKKLNLSYLLSLKEKRDGNWILTIRYGKKIKTIYYNTFEQAHKELKRAYELRTMKYKDAANILRGISN